MLFKTIVDIFIIPPVIVMKTKARVILIMMSMAIALFVRVNFEKEL